MPESTPRTARRASLTLVGVALSLGIGAVLYRLLVSQQLEQTSALFIGVPTALAIFVALLPPAENAYMVTLKATTLALLMSGIVLGEGFACILMSAPLFFLVALLATSVVLAVRRSRDRRDQVLRSVVLLPLLLSSAEGLHPSLSMERFEEVAAERVVHAPVAVVQATLAATPDFDRIPVMLRLGFPQPVRAEGSGLSVGDRRTISFAGGEGSPGALEVRVRESEPGRVVFSFPEDQSRIAHWLRWQSAEVRWRAAGPDRTRVRFTIRYERRLDPAWYFGPIERGFVRRTASYLIDALTGAG